VSGKTGGLPRHVVIGVGDAGATDMCPQGHGGAMPLHAIVTICQTQPNPDGDVFASIGWRSTEINVWRVSDGTLLHTLTGHNEPIFAISLSPDGRLLASGSDDNTVKLWRVSDGALLHTFGGHSDNVAGVAFSPDGRQLASAAHDHTVKVWWVGDGALLHTLTGDERYFPASLAYGSDGHRLVSGTFNGRIMIWAIP